MHVFISHSSVDKPLVKELANRLKIAGIDVWYDEWQIDFGDSIIDKVFNALASSDILLVMLSSSSVKSKWVNEELSVGIMRRLSGANIRVIPVLIEECDIPISLKHIKYVNLKGGYDNLVLLINSIAPKSVIWEELNNIYKIFCSLKMQILHSNDNDDIGYILIALHDLLERSLNKRIQIVYRDFGIPDKEHGFYDKIRELKYKGIDTRSTVWHALVQYRSMMAHAIGGGYNYVTIFAEMLDSTGQFAVSPYQTMLNRPPINQEKYDRISSAKEAVDFAVEELDAIFKLMCFEEWPQRNPFEARK